ncbi:MAG: DUF6516 family protein [Methanosarcinales archaeon]
MMYNVFETYLQLRTIAEDSFLDIIQSTSFIGERASQPNKLRIYFVDGSLLDIWLTSDGDYSYHWEHRAQRGMIHRWDNAPHHTGVDTYPDHFHNESEECITTSNLSKDPTYAIIEVLKFIRKKLKEYQSIK